MDKIMERMMKAKELQIEKKMMTERGTPAEIRAKLGKPEPTMNFGSNKDKFKSGFGKDGSAIVMQRKDFSASQRIEVNKIGNVSGNSSQQISPPKREELKEKPKSDRMVQEK
jgi:hypothetical protein